MTASSPEMEHALDALDGEWLTRSTYTPNPDLPEGGQGEGQETVRPGPGRHSLIIDTRSNGPLGPFEGHGFIVWSDGRYRLTWLTSADPGVGAFEGLWIGNDLVFDGVEHQNGAALASRHSVVDLQPDAFRYRIEMGPTREALRTVMTIEYRRAAA
jgi:hypothetical protein